MLPIFNNHSFLNKDMLIGKLAFLEFVVLRMEAATLANRKKEEI